MIKLIGETIVQVGLFVVAFSLFSRGMYIESSGFAIAAAIFYREHVVQIHNVFMKEEDFINEENT